MLSMGPLHTDHAAEGQCNIMQEQVTPMLNAASPRTTFKALVMRGAAKQPQSGGASSCCATARLLVSPAVPANHVRIKPLPCKNRQRVLKQNKSKLEFVPFSRLCSNMAVLQSNCFLVLLIFCSMHLFRNCFTLLRIAVIGSEAAKGFCTE